MPLLLADLIYSRDCKLNLRKNVDTTAEMAAFLYAGRFYGYVSLPNSKKVGRSLLRPSHLL